MNVEIIIMPRIGEQKLYTEVTLTITVTIISELINV